MKLTHCKKCHTKLKEGSALVNRLGGNPDFIGTKEVVTLSYNGKADLKSVLKCPKCGQSYTMGKNE